MHSWRRNYIVSTHRTIYILKAVASLMPRKLYKFSAAHAEINIYSYNIVADAGKHLFRGLNSWYRQSGKGLVRRRREVLNNAESRGRRIDTSNYPSIRHVGSPFTPLWLYCHYRILCNHARWFNRGCCIDFSRKRKGERKRTKRLLISLAIYRGSENAIVDNSVMKENITTTVKRPFKKISLCLCF